MGLLGCAFQMILTVREVLPTEKLFVVRCSLLLIFFFFT